MKILINIEIVLNVTIKDEISKFVSDACKNSDTVLSLVDFSRFLKWGIFDFYS